MRLGAASEEGGVAAGGEEDGGVFSGFAVAKADYQEERRFCLGGLEEERGGGLCEEKGEVGDDYGRSGIGKEPGEGSGKKDLGGAEGRRAKRIQEKEDIEMMELAEQWAFEEAVSRGWVPPAEIQWRREAKEWLPAKEKKGRRKAEGVRQGAIAAEEEKTGVLMWPKFGVETQEKEQEEKKLKQQ